MALKKRKRRVTGLSSSTKDYPRLTLDQALDLVISSKRVEGVRDRTLRDYEKMFGYFRTWLDDNYEVEYFDEIDTDTIRNYVNYCKYDKPKYSGHKYIKSEKQEVGLSDTTININLRCLKSLWNHLDREGYIEVNPLEKIKIIKQDTDDLGNGFTEEEIKVLFQQPNKRDYVGWRDFVGMNTLYDSGLRVQELLTLRAGDVDFQSRFITVNADKAKGRKSRLVPISTHVAKMLLQLISENREHFKTDRIFLSSYGEPLGQNHFNKRLKYYAELAGIDPKKKKVTAHAYRHAWATAMIKNGIDPFTLQKLGGWADIRTMRKYIQMDTSQMRESHDNYSPINLMKRTKH